MRILLAEDDIRLAEPLSEFLTREHHSVTWLSDGQQALDSLLDGGYQLALLDWMLPSRDGLSIVREMRRRGDTTLVLMLTARDGLNDMVEGLQAGPMTIWSNPFAWGNWPPGSVP